MLSLSNMLTFISLFVVALVPSLVAAQDVKCSPLHLIYGELSQSVILSRRIELIQQDSKGNNGSQRLWRSRRIIDYRTQEIGSRCDNLSSRLSRMGDTISRIERTELIINIKADWSGCATETKGINDILKHIDAISKACPEQKFVLGGHSQGSVVVTNSIPKIPQAVKANLLAVTMFGAPPCPAEVKDKCKSYCNAGDDVSPFPLFIAQGTRRTEAN